MVPISGQGSPLVPGTGSFVGGAAPANGSIAWRPDQSLVPEWRWGHWSSPPQLDKVKFGLCTFVCLYFTILDPGIYSIRVRMDAFSAFLLVIAIGCQWYKSSDWSVYEITDTLEPTLYKPQRYLNNFEVLIMLFLSVLDLSAVVKNVAITAVKVNQNISIEVGFSLFWTKFGKVLKYIKYISTQLTFHQLLTIDQWHFTIRVN